MLEAIAARGRIVGFDLTEVSPPNDFESTTARLASFLIIEFLSAVHRRNRTSSPA
jgi:agmatinase